MPQQVLEPNELTMIFEGHTLQASFRKKEVDGTVSQVDRGLAQSLQGCMGGREPEGVEG